CVLNANRPETDTVEGMLEHLHSIEIETGLKFHGLINNTHLLRETTADDIVKGYKLCRQVSDKLGIPIVWNTCREDLLDDLKQLIADENIEGLENIYPIKLYMRPTWLDR
ncbi:MAG: ATP-binding protein, partial [Firmicutes bacterium]|nr:ATP-binding protein [Bacillota bacterium]